MHSAIQRRSPQLEIIVAILIAFEIVITLNEIHISNGH